MTPCPEWADREIARRCNISVHLVAKVRKEIDEECAKDPDNQMRARASGERRKQVKQGKVQTRAVKPPLTGEALAKQIKANERQAAFRSH
jgi:hypothetical protein